MNIIDVALQMWSPVPGASSWVRNADGVLKRILFQVDQEVNVVILFPI